MPFLTQGKTNWKYILITLILAVVVGGGILGWIKRQEVPLGGLPKIEKPEEEKSPYIKVISPNGGEEWVIGKTYDIKWESTGLEKVVIDLYGPIPDSKPFSKQIATGVSASSGKYSWTVSKDVPPGDSFVIIISREGEVYPRDESDDYFGVVKDETADWEIYRNEEYGFEIKYPKDWTFQAIKYSEEFNLSEENPVAFVRFYPKSKRWIDFITEANVNPIGILIFRRSSQQYLSEFSEEDKKEILINKMTAIKIEGKVEGKIYQYVFGRPRGEGYIVISNSISELMARLELLFKTKFPEEDEFHTIFNLMLPSFRFLE